MAVSEQGNQSGSKPAGGGGYFAHVDGLRTIAVLGVLWAHFHVPGLPGGFLGVDVFFVISGYLITRLIIKEKLATGGFSYRRFYLRRVRRLLPAALATIALSLAAFFPILGEKDLISFLRSIPFAILPLANVNYYLEVGYFDTAAAFKPLLHFWSLSVEEQFYFIWPTALLMLLAFPRAVLPVTLALLAASVIASPNYGIGKAFHRPNQPLGLKKRSSTLHLHKQRKSIAVSCRDGQHRHNFTQHPPCHHL